MLRLNCLIALATIFFFAACRKDNQKSIIGKWRSVENYWVDGTAASWKDLEPHAQHTVRFKPDGQFEMTNSPFTYGGTGCSGEYKTGNNSTLIWDQCNPGEEYEVKISFEGSHMIMTFQENHYAVLLKTKYIREQ